MYIANPIYDVVFKYMMEDNRVAKKFISAIIDEKVIELNFLPQEHVLSIEPERRNYTVYHLDFSAKIETETGHRSVIIEVQKALLPTDIMRFRRYLGGQYQDPSNSVVDSEGKRKALQIYCIFFLGQGLGIKGIPVLEVNHQTTDRTTKKEVEGGKNEFIEGLHHRSWIIQVPEVPQHRRNDLEKLLGIFDQSNRTSDSHILNVSEKDFPEEYRPIIRRLQQAAENKEMKNTMIAEDFYLENFKINERIIAYQTKALSEKDKALSEKDKALLEKEKMIEILIKENAELKHNKKQ